MQSVISLLLGCQLTICMIIVLHAQSCLLITGQYRLALMTNIYQLSLRSLLCWFVLALWALLHIWILIIIIIGDQCIWLIFHIARTFRKTTSIQLVIQYSKYKNHTFGQKWKFGATRRWNSMPSDVQGVNCINPINPINVVTFTNIVKFWATWDTWNTS